MYEYWVKDCLGNTRVAFKESSGSFTVDVLQRNDYYPFGKTKARGSTSSSKTSYLYNGKEEQEGFDVLDYGARFYDPIIGRWHQGDPLAEQFHDQSPYKYAGNNPINMTDPDGMGEIYGQASGNFGNVSTQFNASPLSYKGESYADMDELQEANPGTVFAMDAKTGNYVGFDDDEKKKKAAAEPQKDIPLSHDQELAKYGQINYAYNLTTSIVIIGGATHEFGIIKTDKGWCQYYETIYFSSGLSLSWGGNGAYISAKPGQRITFSDWKGAAGGLGMGFGYASLSGGTSATYNTVGVGAAMGLNLFKQGGKSGAVSIGYTRLLGKPYQYNNIGKASFINSYISTQTYMGGQ